MRYLQALIDDGVHGLRLVTPGQWLLRLFCTASLLLAVALCWFWFPVVAGELVAAVAIAAALLTAIRPESWAALVAVAAVAVWWLAAGTSAEWWQTASIAGLLGLFHLLTAAGAIAPSYSVIGARALLSMLRSGFTYALVCLGGVALVLTVTELSAGRLPFGLLWISLALVATGASAGLILKGLETKIE